MSSSSILGAENTHAIMAENRVGHLHRQKGGVDRWRRREHILWWSKLKRGGHYFYLVGREWGTYLFLAFNPLKRWICSLIWACFKTKAVILLLHHAQIKAEKKFTAVTFPWNHLLLSVLLFCQINTVLWQLWKERKKESQTFYSPVNIFSTPGGGQRGMLMPQNVN